MWFQNIGYVNLKYFQAQEYSHSLAAKYKNPCSTLPFLLSIWNWLMNLENWEEFKSNFSTSNWACYWYSGVSIQAVELETKKYGNGSSIWIINEKKKYGSSFTIWIVKIQTKMYGNRFTIWNKLKKCIYE